ncbi:hypothetical protein K1T71_000094 [Dendrolimus kikuchii]|uniref:Uncharacterized protein n=1 Tax=Dendrolimus kikuchii TaxID=765133 RepID=A0ACC1DIE8_9NEOP|nr:hypothetical protein K1T71_000094 [Dendrolimus kikuchii]
MGSRSPVPELKCMDPDKYGKHFQGICLNNSTRKSEKKPHKKAGKKEKLCRQKPSSAAAACFAPTLLANPSQFAVYATVRQSILHRWRHLQSGVTDISDESDNEDATSLLPITKLPKITGIGLRTVFSLISQARFRDANFCELSLMALLDVLQGHAPEELAQEPSEIIANLHSMLAEVARGTIEIRPHQRRTETPTALTAISSSCLVALSVARGEAELILSAVSTLIISSPSLSDQHIQVPSNLTTLQRSVQSVLLGNASRNQWLNHGVPEQSLFSTTPIDLPVQWIVGTGDLVLRSLCSDGVYLYVFTSRGIMKIGSGYGSSVTQHTYLFRGDFFAIERHGWLGYCKNKLYVRVGRKKTEVYEVDKNSLEIRKVLRLDPGTPLPLENKSAIFTDGNQLGLMMLTNFDNLIIRMYSLDNYPPRTDSTGITVLTSNKDITINLLRTRTLALGRAPFDDNMSRRTLDLDIPVAMQLDDSEEDPLISICGGQDFGLLTTTSGKVYYTGKGASLGYKSASPNTGRWTLMKETMLTRNEAPNAKKSKVIQVAVGHEGVHAILVLDNGTALFTGVARRGEDGDGSKHRRTPKPTRPKKIFKVEGHHVVYAACNYGSTALVTRQGLLLMFGKDTQHCDSTGLVIGLRHEKVIQVALGKAHAAALTNFGQVFTFGINNKGQCGREFGYTKEKSFSNHQKSNNKEDKQICQTNHTWKTDYCRVCVLCRECTGFSNACHCAHLPNRVPGEKCGCGEGDSGCSVCGVCRTCAEIFDIAGKSECNATDDEDVEPSTKSDTKSDKDNTKYTQYEGHTGPETERDASLKVSSLPPARVSVPGGHKVSAVACGLHHTVILTEHGEVLTFGSNQYGQLGVGDILTHHRIVRVRVPRAAAIAAGSNHTAVLTREGELYTFGNYQNGCLGRPRPEDTAHSDRSPVWYATPSHVPGVGSKYSCKAVWVSASGDQTFVQVSQSLINTDTLFSCTITSNSNCIIILPNRPEHSFKCITINKTDGTCHAWVGPEQVDFVNTLACLDPSYDVLWCYQPQLRQIKCYNILTFDPKNAVPCYNPDPSFLRELDLEFPDIGFTRHLEEFKNVQTFEFSINKEKQSDVPLSKTSLLNQELAIPTTPGFSITRMHAALYLLGCLDSLIFAHETRLNNVESKRDRTSSPVAPVKEDFLTVNRFDSHGGGWGYSGHSVEAIRFMCDTDILLGGYGLFGGRGDYTAKIKLFDIGPDGGDQEGDGELIAESDEIVYECAPRDRFPVLFESPIPIVANRWYVAWACINGPSSDCGSSGQAMVIYDEIGFHFKTSKKSNNGTDVNAGQIPSLLYNTVSSEHSLPMRTVEPGEPVITLSKNISRKVTVPCFKSLISLLLWSWSTFQEVILDTNGLLAINYQKLIMMKYQKRLVYITRACLRLVKSYIIEIYPQQSRKRNSQEFMSFFDAIAEVRNVIQRVMADPIPTCSMLPRRPGKNKMLTVCNVQFPLEMINSVLTEAHETFTACFYAFFPTPILKWSHLCSLLFNVKDGNVPHSQIQELTSTCAALCASRSLRDVLQYIVPVTQGCINLTENRRPDNKQDPTTAKQDHNEWHLLDVIPRLLDIIINPMKQKMFTRQCPQPHDHGEIKQQARLSEFCSKLIARIIAEMTHSATNIREELDTNTVKPLTSPSRFMRVNQSRAWNTGNGSPDAICFTVDRPGVVLVGVCVYGGLGNYEYSMELLHDQLRAVGDETNSAHCWVSVEVAHGAFCASDCHQDTVQLKFDKPIPLKEDLRYAIRLCNHGGRTANGDCGLPSVKGSDGTTFKFSSCTLSFNGTTLARGQIPSLIYYSTSKSLHNSSESADALITTLRAITMRVASIVMDRSAEFFCSLRNEMSIEDLRRNESALQQSHAINTLIPFVLANLECLDDAKSIIKLLDMIHKVLPHVAAINLLMPVNEDVVTTPTCFYTWVESDHPYTQATVTNMRVIFPGSVSWVVLEMDPRSVTAQPEDTLTVYAVSGSSGTKCQCKSEVRTVDPPFRKRLVQLTAAGEVEALDDDDVPCMHNNCNYVSVTPKLANVASDWPQKALIIPGSEVIFSLETATDYLNEYNKSNNAENRFGFRCLCIGYEDTPMTSQKQGLPALEMELVYAGAASASRLLAPDLDIPPLSFSTIVEVQVQAMIGSSPTGNEGELAQDATESLLLSRGLELSSPPTIHQVLDGQPLLR